MCLEDSGLKKGIATAGCGSVCFREGMTSQWMGGVGWVRVSDSVSLGIGELRFLSLCRRDSSTFFRNLCCRKTV